jgi:methyl-accepting chemotaxis protein
LVGALLKTSTLTQQVLFLGDARMGLFQTIQAKIVALLMVFFVVQGVVLLGINAKLGGVFDDYRKLIEMNVHQKAEIDAINLDFKTQVQEWKNVLLRGHEPANLEKYWAKFEVLHALVQSNTKKLMSADKNEALTGQIRAFENAHLALLPKYQEGLAVFKSQGFNAQAADRVVQGIDRESSETLLALSAAIDAHVEQRTAKLNDTSARLGAWVYVIVIGMSVVACGILSLVLQALVVQPIKQLRRRADEMATGDFSTKIALNSYDELGDLATSLNKMRAELCAMLGAVIHVSQNLSRSSTVLTAAAKGIDNDTHHAQDHAGQIAAAMTQMSASIAEVASNASIAADGTNQAKRGAADGMRIMEEAIRAISVVREEVTKISADMSRLEQNTTSVGAVLDVIKGIAEQTNLLALNAAIEAARAGEQGRGFAVVADEVRALAKRTQESTEEIHHIIEAVQNGAKAAASGMEAGNQKTEHAVSLARDAGAAIRKIVDEIDRVEGMSSQIATAAEEQSVATEEINRNVVNMTGLSEKAHDSAASTHHIAAELVKTADSLRGMTTKFKLPS